MYLTMKEVAEKIGCSWQVIQYHVKQKNIPSMKMNNGRVFIKEKLLSAIREIIKEK